MTESLMLQAIVRLACSFLPVLLAVSVKVSILITLVFLSVWVMKGASARLKHISWLCAVTVSLFALILSVRGPLFELNAPHMPLEYEGAFAAVSSSLLPSAGTFAPRMSLIATEMWRQASLGRQWIDSWPAAALFLWMAGVLSGWLRILWGRLQLRKLTCKEQSDPKGQYQSLTDALSQRMGTSPGVRVFESDSCTTPLTHGFFHPVIVLPASMRTWSMDRTRSVLLHELLHVGRRDSFTLGVAYGICSLFWFVPPVWAAYARLYLEQEKACDAAVVESGVKRAAYAACILDAAQLCREPVLFAGLSFSRQRKHVLKDRIRTIIGGRKSAKNGALAFALSAVLVGAVLASSVWGIDTTGLTGKKYGQLYLKEYRPKTADEASILDALITCEAAFNSHDLPRMLSLFSKDAIYHPCGTDWKRPIATQECQNRLQSNFGLFKFERFYDPRISVSGNTAVVNLLVESGDYLADYTFVLKRANRGWLVSKADYANDHAKS